MPISLIVRFIYNSWFKRLMNYLFLICRYETANGIVGEQQGYLKDIGAEEPALQVQGSNSYPAPDGQIISIQYTANENGYQPIGDHLPVPPPSPPAILRALEIPINDLTFVKIIFNSLLNTHHTTYL